MSDNRWFGYYEPRFKENDIKIINNMMSDLRLIDANALEEKAVSYLLDGDFDEWAVPLDEIRNALTIEPKWIPVSERLPERPKNYPHCEIRRTYFLVSLESGCVKSLGFEFEKMDWQITGGTVVAWMPLPQPYERKSNG